MNNKLMINNCNYLSLIKLNKNCNNINKKSKN